MTSVVFLLAKRKQVVGQKGARNTTKESHRTQYSSSPMDTYVAAACRSSPMVILVVVRNTRTANRPQTRDIVNGEPGADQGKRTYVQPP